ncbi:MAG TPA: hypothetical protein PLN05_10370, partial [Pyrinomonadaceae bacterium]|nr:hypothetical protein [Pyrinomonadaceae bacterium]HRK50821.1 hypothetical protein [Pyrinomonadaceae bacterium]
MDTQQKASCPLEISDDRWDKKQNGSAYRNAKPLIFYACRTMPLMTTTYLTNAFGIGRSVAAPNGM